MWRKLRERSKARRASKAAPQQPAPPSSSSSSITTNPAGPHSGQQRAAVSLPDINDSDLAGAVDPSAAAAAAASAAQGTSPSHVNHAQSDTPTPLITRSPSLPQAPSSNPSSASSPPAGAEPGRSRTDVGTRADTSIGRPTSAATATASLTAQVEETSDDTTDSQTPSSSADAAQPAAPTTTNTSVLQQHKSKLDQSSASQEQQQQKQQQQGLPPQSTTTHTISANNSQLDDSMHSGIVSGTNRRTPSLNLSRISEYAPVSNDLGSPNVNGTLSLDIPHHSTQTSQQQHHDRYRRLSLDGDLPPSAIRPDDRGSQPDAGNHGEGSNDEHEEGEENDDLEDSHSEGVFNVDPTATLPGAFDVAACSKAGWEPMRGPIPNIPAAHTVEVRKENQDAYCVHVPFLPTSVEDGDISPSHHADSTNDQYANHVDTTSPAPHLVSTGKKGPSQMFLGVFDGHGAQGRPIAHYARDFISVSCRESASRLDPSAFQSSRSPSTSLSSPIHSKQLHRPSLGLSGGGNHNPSVLFKSDPTAHRARLDTLRAAFSCAERALTESDCGIDHVFSGTTAVVSWLFGRELYTAWTGDSRGVIGRIMSPSNSSHSNSSTSVFGDGGNNAMNGRVKFRAIDLSHDQKPSRTDEKRRVRAAGGRIARWQRNMGPLRVWLPRDWTPGLAMTRSIGDTVLSEYGVCPVPEVSYTMVGPNDSFIVLASDGVWEFMTSQEVVDLVGRARRDGHSAEEASELLVNEAVRRWRRNEVVVDDTTAVVMYMRWSHDVTSADHGGGGGLEHVHGDPSVSSTSQPYSGSEKKEPLFAKSRNILSRTRAKVSLKGPPAGVYLVSETGHLAEFLCKNDTFQGV